MRLRAGRGSSRRRLGACPHAACRFRRRVPARCLIGQRCRCCLSRHGLVALGRARRRPGLPAVRLHLARAAGRADSPFWHRHARLHAPALACRAP
eukprot:15440957-Alexandrium_andersonii.AAC.1